MAKGGNNQNAEATAEADSTESKSDSRHIMIDVPTGDPSGLSGSQKRVDVIRALAKTGEFTRGAIAKHITELQGGKKLAYQQVFQATRGIEGIPAAQRGKPAEEGASDSTEEVTEEAVA